jgi:biotin transport system substrate-specific component
MNMKTESKNRTRTLEITMIALMTSVIVVSAWISIPTVIPFTLQTFAVFASISILGGRDGLISVILYLFLGAVGIPVFSGFKAGIGIIMGPTGGYLIGFIFIALIYMLFEHLFVDNLIAEIASMVIGLMICYLFGTLWFTFVYGGGGEIGFGAAVGMCVVPFIIPDIIKMILAISIARILKKRINLSFR